MFIYRDITGKTLEEITAQFSRALRELSTESAIPTPELGILLPKLNVVPNKPREGLVVFADGTNWNPGSGEGVYIYRSGAWHFLG